MLPIHTEQDGKIPFYVTYGSQYKQNKNYSVVWAKDYSEARKIINEAIGNKFAFCYDHEDFIVADQPGKYGLTEIPLQPQTM